MSRNCLLGRLLCNDVKNTCIMCGTCIPHTPPPPPQWWGHGSARKCLRACSRFVSVTHSILLGSTNDWLSKGIEEGNCAVIGNVGSTSKYMYSQMETYCYHNCPTVIMYILDPRTSNRTNFQGGMSFSGLFSASRGSTGTSKWEEKDYCYMPTMMICMLLGGRVPFLGGTCIWVLLGRRVLKFLMER